MTEAVSRPAGTIRNASTGERAAPKSSARKLYEIFTPRERVQAGLLFLGNLFAAFAQVIGVAIIFPFINVAMNPQVINENKWLDAFYKRGTFADSNSFIVFLGTVVFVTIIVSSLAPAAVSWAQTRFLLKKEHAISLRLLAVYLSRPYQYFLGKNTSELGKNVLSEVGGLTMGMLTALFELLIQGTLLVVLISMLLFVDVLVTVGAMLLLGGGYALLSFLIKTKLQKSGKERLTANAARFRYATEALSGIKTTRVMGIELYFLNNYADNSLTYARLQIFANLAGTLPRYFLEAIAFGGIVLFFVLRLAAGGSISELIPLVSLYAFSAYRMMPALYRLYYAATQLHYYQAVLDKIHIDMLDINADEESSSDNNHLPFERAIRLQNIDFRYADAQTDVINGLDINIPKNASVGFVGATGSGKTTLVDIILGLLLPQKGRMLIDDTPITEKNVRAWRRKIGYVPQEIYLSDDSVRKNIAFGVPDDEIDDDRVREATSIAALDDFIQTLPEKYDTVIGERGVRLSGGQRQRIGLARALYRNPEILVLDEATNSLDGATEETVLSAVRSASKARTVIVIAHRLNTLKDCDVIYIMENGRFAANGTYDELLHGNKTFMRMAKVGNA